MKTIKISKNQLFSRILKYQKKFIKNVDLAIIMKKGAEIKLARTYGILLIVPKLAWMDLYILML